MKFSIDKKSTLSILAVIAIGVVLALAILFWKKEPVAEQGEGAGEHAEETAEKSPAAEKGHDDDKPGNRAADATTR